MKIALIKQDVYQDLYVGDNNFDKIDLLFSSQGRVGPFGLFSMFDADFYIVEEEHTKECEIWTKIIPNTKKLYRRLKNETLDKLPGQGFKVVGSNKPNGYYSVKCESIDWGIYDIVISINVSIPTKIVQKYKDTLWAYMIGEANYMVDNVYFGYDVALNQECRGIIKSYDNIIDFPYTFVGPKCLEEVMKLYLGRCSENNGIYGEINCVSERPVTRIPQFEPVKEATGQPVRMHKQLIKENLKEIYDSKYYLKIGGRLTRGNGAIEAISLGTLVLMSPNDIIHSQILPKECWVFNEEDAINKIKELDSNPKLYNELLNKQRDLLNQFIVDYPMRSLTSALEEKRRLNKSNSIRKYSNIKYTLDRLQKLKLKIKYKTK